MEEYLLTLRRGLPHNGMRGTQNENVIGDHIRQSKNCYCCFDTTSAEDCAYACNVNNVTDCYDVNFAALGAELIYEVHSGAGLKNSNFCNVCWQSSDLEYCEYVFNSHDCFGCVSRNHASYEILNVKYDPKEYAARVEKIKKEMRAEGGYGKHLESVYEGGT